MKNKILIPLLSCFAIGISILPLTNVFAQGFFSTPFNAERNYIPEDNRFDGYNEPGSYDNQRLPDPAGMMNTKKLYLNPAVTPGMGYGRGMMPFMPDPRSMMAPPGYFNEYVDQDSGNRNLNRDRNFGYQKNQNNLRDQDYDGFRNEYRRGKIQDRDNYSSDDDDDYRGYGKGKNEGRNGEFSGYHSRKGGKYYGEQRGEREGNDIEESIFLIFGIIIGLLVGLLFSNRKEIISSIQKKPKE